MLAVDGFRSCKGLFLAGMTLTFSELVNKNRVKSIGVVQGPQQVFCFGLSLCGI